MIDKVLVFMGDEELTKEDIKKYSCISPFVGEMINKIYYRNKKARGY